MENLARSNGPLDVFWKLVADLERQRGEKTIVQKAWIANAEERTDPTLVCRGIADEVGTPSLV